MGENAFIALSCAIPQMSSGGAVVTKVTCTFTNVSFLLRIGCIKFASYDEGGR
ncbi:hypothetical protein [Halobacillus sp. B23F22_1]|uniref:hypothetical protein n=1 Tax=Halobacillus sp. B23F22_1 TaxID=3459514 RepID=UPI00373E384E